MLVLAYDERSATAFGVEDDDAQSVSLQYEEVTAVRLTKPEDASHKERTTIPFFAPGVKEKVVQMASSWLVVIAAEEEAERRRQEEFDRKQLKLPGVE